MANARPTPADGPETVLIVDDEESVRRTFREWLDGANLGVRVLAAADAENALRLANEQTIDLAVLDWNLGAGNDGLQLLEDLFLFNADVVAIMITGYAHQATPLAAMRMGVRDYLDKNQDLDRDTFLASVRKQVERIRPAKRERRLHGGLVAFREAVAKVLPLVESAAALNDPLSPSESVARLFRFLLRSTRAKDGVLLVRSYDQKQQAETFRAYGTDGKAIGEALSPFARSLAGAAASLGETRVIHRPSAIAGVELQPFERNRQSLLIAPLQSDAGMQVAIELLDRQALDGQVDANGFTDADRLLVAAAADFGGEMLRHALADRQAHRVLFEAIRAALEASESLAASLQGSAGDRQVQPPSSEVQDRLREGFAGGPAGDEAVRLAETVRVLAVKYGPAAVRYCIRMAEGLARLLDEAGGLEEAGP